MSGMVLCYHRVIEENKDGSPTPWHARGTAVTPDIFRRHLDDLEERFDVLGPEALLDESLPDGSVVLTFDDASPDLAETIIPELTRRGLRAALFPITSVFEGKTYVIDRFYDAINRCHGKEFHHPDVNGFACASLLTQSEIRRMVRSDLKLRIVGLGEDAHGLVDELLEMNGLGESDIAEKTAEAIRTAADHGWLIGLHGHHHLSFTIHDAHDVWDDIRAARSTLEAQGITAAPLVAVTDGRLPQGSVDNEFHSHTFLSIAQSFEGKGVVVPFQERWMVPPRERAILEAHQTGAIESVDQREEGIWHEDRPVGEWLKVNLNSEWIVESTPFRSKKNRTLHHTRCPADGRRGVLKVHEFKVLDEAEFKREMKHLQACQGRGVAKMLDSGEIQGWGTDNRTVLGFVTEHLKPLQKKMEPNAAITAWSSMVETLGRLNDLGFVHCDVKPGNIIVGEDGEPCLIDFAESLYIPDSASRDKVSRQEDVYNLGKLLHRLVTGDRVYVLPPERVLAQKYPGDESGDIKHSILAMCNPDYRERPSIEELMLMSSKLQSNLSLQEARM